MLTGMVEIKLGTGDGCEIPFGAEVAENGLNTFHDPAHEKKRMCTP
jgi:hypothetical protein